MQAPSLFGRNLTPKLSNHLYSALLSVHILCKRNILGKLSASKRWKYDSRLPSIWHSHYRTIKISLLIEGHRNVSTRKKNIPSRFGVSLFQTPYFRFAGISRCYGELKSTNYATNIFALLLLLHLWFTISSRLSWNSVEFRSCPESYIKPDSVISAQTQFLTGFPLKWIVINGTFSQILYISVLKCSKYSHITSLKYASLAALWSISLSTFTLHQT